MKPSRDVVVLAVMLIGVAQVIGGLDHWEDLQKPAIVSGLLCQFGSLLLAVFSVGIGTGSLLCERMSGHKIEIGLVPFGSIGMTVFAVDLYFASSGLKPEGLAGVMAFLSTGIHWRILADLFLLD